MSNPQNINQSIQYQNDAVVSKEIAQKPTGTVTIFAFDQDQGLSEHTTPFDALVFVTEGMAEITVSGITHIVKEGEMLLMPANEPHKLQAIKKFKMMLIMIKS